MRAPIVFLPLLVACSSKDSASADLDTGTEPAAFDRWSPPDAVGPYGVAVRTLEFTDARGKDLKVDVWYPAIVEDDDVKGAYESFLPALEVYRNLPLDTRGGPHPVAAFSHGMQAIRFQSASTMEYLASHGWIIVAPDHPFNTPIDWDEDKMPQALEERPGDVASAVDGLIDWAATTGGDWENAFDASRYAVMGHSLGSITALAVAGGEVDFDGAVARCAEGTAAGIACRNMVGVDPERLAGTAGHDPRAEAVVPMSPGVWYAFGYDGEGLADLPPALVLAGTRDPILPYDTEAVPTYAAIGGTKMLATFEDAGHYLFSDMCTLLPPSIIENFTSECSGGDEWLPPQPAQSVSNALLTAWLDVHFRGEERSAEWITEAGLGSPDYLSLESVAR